MKKEYQESIDYIQKQIDYYKQIIKFIEEEYRNYFEVYETYKNIVKQFETVLSMLKEKDKQIDLMADYMLSGLEDIAFNNICKQGHCVHNLKDNRPTKCRKCKECIKQYFERRI